MSSSLCFTEDRWIERVLAAREVELRGLVKARINGMFMSLMWTLSSVFVSVGSFFVYVQLGNKLDVATAFTAITLFSMVRQPLNTLPMFIVQILQTGVAVNRVAAFLDEEEVSEQVSVLKRAAAAAGAASAPAPTREADVDGRFGFARANIKWNESETKDDDKKKKDAKVKRSWFPWRWRRSRNASDAASEAPTVAVTDEDHKFELRDLDLVFPEGVLTVVTGPTASGKTALLVSTFHCSLFYTAI
jgi:ABC-type multidrug transport system fused ATPase/permease subunit